MALKVLLVEDDRDLRQTLRDALSVEGYEVVASGSSADASAVLRNTMASGSPLDLLVLDLGLPDGDGGDLLRSVRAQYALPILIISARHDDANKVALLDAGADDYLVKPFSISELLARMRVTLRHRGTVVLAPQTQYNCGALDIDLPKHTVFKAGEAVHLTPTEFKLLARLVRQAGQVVTHRQLLVDVWGAEHVDQTQYLRLYMGQLRAKLEPNPTEPALLLTEPGVGYRLAE
ncbi:two-component system response regulator KdpE [Limnohabitans sp. Jir61]|uniref:response regulator n=1 Tax=Limnohabitans sp. Jir61 TaxID=1826168 RepID=UPI000D3C0AE2|nr:response regulator [Limnohabitans sp. Jir61]PUE29570.1 two-component system response regulator KdpE [Limnohabitans sp. Jir61]